MKCAKVLDRCLVRRRVHIRWRMDDLVIEVVEALPEHGVDDDRRARLRLPDPEMPGRVTGQCQNLHAQLRSEPKPFAPGELEIDTGIRSHTCREHLFAFLVVVRSGTMLGIPAVALAHGTGAVGNDRHVEGRRAEDRPRRPHAYRMIPTEVIDIGVAGEHVRERFGRKGDLLENGTITWPGVASIPVSISIDFSPRSRYCAKGRGPKTLSIRSIPGATSTTVHLAVRTSRSRRRSNVCCVWLRRSSQEATPVASELIRSSSRESANAPGSARVVARFHARSRHVASEFLF